MLIEDFNLRMNHIWPDVGLKAFSRHAPPTTRHMLRATRHALRVSL